MQKISFMTMFKERPIYAMFIVISLSVIMFIIGNIAPDNFSKNTLAFLGSSRLEAASQEVTTPEIIRLDKERLGGNNLGKFEAYEPDFGDLIARGHDYFYSKDGNFGIGVWESKPGQISYTNLEYDELMYVLEGSMIMTNEHGKVETFTQGEGLVLPKGWSGTLAVPEGGVRKIWVSYMAGVKGE